jgi:hypothetical protein
MLTPKLMFSHNRVSCLTGLDRRTLKHWCEKGWVHPVSVRDAIRRGLGIERHYGGWQLLGLGVIACANEAVRAKGSYLGRTAVVGVMQVIEGMDDEVFFADGMPDDAVIKLAGWLFHLVMPDLQVTAKMFEAVGYCTLAVDREVKAIKERHNLSTAG